MKSLLRNTKQQWQRDTGDPASPRVIRDGVLVTDEDVWVWLRIPDGSSQLVEDSEVEQHTGTLTHTLRTSLPVGAEYHLKVLWAQTDDRDYVASWDQFSSVRAPGISDYIAYGAHRIARQSEAGAVRQRVVLLGVRWPTRPPTGSASASAWMRQGLRSERGQYRAAHERLAAVRQRVDDWIAQLVASPLRAQRASAATIAWTWAREFRGGALHTVPRNTEFAGGRLASLADGEVDPSEDASYVVVRDARTGHTRYVSCLVPAVNGFAPELTLPGGEWLEILSEVPGVEASVRGVQHGQQGSLSMLGDAERMTTSQDREASEQGKSAQPEVYDASEAIAERKRDVSQRLDVETTNHPRWVVTGDSPEQLQQRVDTLVQTYAGVVELVTPPYVQDLLWQELLPGDRVRVPEFGQDQPLRTLVGSWFHGGSAVGDTTGPYLGINVGTTPGPVQLHLTSPATEHRSQTTTVTVTGRSGSGKSTAVMLLTLGALADGAWSMLVDGKGDLGGICQVAPQLLGVPLVPIDVTDPACSGMMDPLRVAATADEARSLALSALTGVLHSDDKRLAETVLERAIDRVLARDRSHWSAPAVITELVATSSTVPQADVAHRIGETLEHRAQLAQLRPVLGPVMQEQPAQLPGRGLVYLDLSGLTLPRHSSNPDRWDIPERASITTYRMAMAYALHQSRQYGNVPKWVALTELHLLTGYPEGRSFVEWIARAGRALRLGQLLDSQSAADMAQIPGLVEQIVMSVAFDADGEAEQTAQAELLHRPGDRPRLRTAQQGLGRGEAILRDRYDRLGMLEFDRLAAWIADALDTNAGDDDADVASYDTAAEYTGEGVSA